MTGPDELRKVADSLLTGGSNYRLLRDRLYVYADAWRADKVILMQRLEAAEKKAADWEQVAFHISKEKP
jgi:hypothetical protein